MDCFATTGRFQVRPQYSKKGYSFRREKIGRREVGDSVREKVGQVFCFSNRYSCKIHQNPLLIPHSYNTLSWRPYRQIIYHDPNSLELVNALYFRIYICYETWRSYVARKCHWRSSVVQPQLSTLSGIQQGVHPPLETCSLLIKGSLPLILPPVLEEER